MKKATLIFLVDSIKKQVILGLKKRGYGKDKWNGYGGKVNENESFEAAALRELKEESTLALKPQEIKKVGEITFYAEGNGGGEWEVHVFFAKQWPYAPTETEEMKPGFFSFEQLPFQHMWADDPHWLPRALNGEKIKAKFWFDAKEENLLKQEVKSDGSWE